MANTINDAMQTFERRLRNGGNPQELARAALDVLETEYEGKRRSRTLARSEASRYTCAIELIKRGGTRGYHAELTTAIDTLAAQIQRDELG